MVTQSCKERVCCLQKCEGPGCHPFRNKTDKNWKGEKKKKGKWEEKENKSQTKQMPQRSTCSSQNLKRQPGEIPCEPSLCSHRNSLPLTFVWDQLNHAIWSYFSFQLCTSRLHTSKWIIRDKQASTLLFFLWPLCSCLETLVQPSGLCWSHVGLKGWRAAPTRPEEVAVAERCAIAPSLTYLKTVFAAHCKKLFIKTQPWWRVGSTIT